MTSDVNHRGSSSAGRGARIRTGVVFDLAGSLLIGLLLALSGCGRPSGNDGTNSRRQETGYGTPEEGSSSEQESQADEIPHIPVETLRAKLGAFLPPLDEGRVRLAPPQGWHVEPRSKAYVTRFVFDRTHQAPLPRITILAEPASFDDPRDLDTDNDLLSFLDLVADSVSESTAAAMHQSVTPLVIGTMPCVRYVVHVNLRLGKRTVRSDREMLKTLKDGRVYTVILDSNVGQLKKDRHCAYMVLAGLEFLTPDEK